MNAINKMIAPPETSRVLMESGLRDHHEQEDGRNFAGDCMESHFGLLRMVEAGVGQHIKNETRGGGEKRKRDQAVDLPAKVKVHGGNASASHQHQAADREVRRPGMAS